MNPICLIKSIYRSIRCRAWVSGCDFKEVSYMTPPTIQILECKTCGKISTAWSWESLEEVK